MTPDGRNKVLGSARFAGPIAIAAAAATILLAGMAIAVLAMAERRVRTAVERQQARDTAVHESSACAGAFAAQTAAWKSFMLAELLSDERGAARAKSSLATAAGEMHERLARLPSLGQAAGLPTEHLDAAIRSATDASTAIVEALADARAAGAGSIATAESATSASIQQARFELTALADEWERTASTQRVDASDEAASTARRVKAWIEIVSLLAVALVLAVGTLAIRRAPTDVRA